MAGNNKKSQLAFENLKDICEKYLSGKCHIEVIDLIKDPSLARADQILAVPTLIIKNHPEKKVIGSLSNPEKVLKALNLRTSSPTDVDSEKGYVEKTPTEESKAHTAGSERSKDDLQPYIGSGLFRQRSQNLERWLFSLSHNSC
ncbi:Circadian oscillation regulator KaiB [Methanosarcina horonobensis HB-1 = JCM 15518]|uniref:Circadian oscillation regulator KaiB n=1 Tax=Methanosarcina horonobensis HB-1 = JCM 15518 TaxID=1434110 RepID=A0A0E3S6B8_9EURY|nr:Circadian oscillation regulator KaiB [Methanosarcina horonobensis HB-1 = JCM 15518]